MISMSTRARAAMLPLLFVLLQGCSPGYQAAVPTDAPTPAPAANEPAPAPAEGGSVETKPEGDTGSGPVVVLESSMGDIEIQLDPEKAPITVKNFLSYVDKQHYDGTIFHRVIDGFMIQGGGMTPDLREKPTGSGIQNEGQNGLKNLRGTIAMARTGDPNSATAQFFINVVDNSALDYPQPDGHGYAVFGKVTSGMDVVDKIKAVPTADEGGHSNVPVEDVLIKSIRLKNEGGSS